MANAYAELVMAEIIGAVASGVSIAHLAGTIISVASKTRTLIQQIQGVPEAIQLRLEQLNLITTTLEVLEDDHTDSTRDCFPALQKAKLHCHDCLVELQDILQDLSQKIQVSKGIRKKIALSQVVLKKEVLDTIERRLSHSVEILTIAHQIYTMYWIFRSCTFGHKLMISRHLIKSQKQDFKFAVKEITQSIHEQKEINTLVLYNSSRSLKPTHARLNKSHGYHSQAQYSMWSRSPLSPTHWSLGVNILTGTIEVEVSTVELEAPLMPGGGGTCNKGCAESPRFRIRYWLPRWWSYKIMELVAYQAKGGWMHCFRTRNIVPGYDRYWWKAVQFIYDGRLHALRKLIDKGRVSAVDQTSNGDRLLCVNSTLTSTIMLPVS